MNEDRPDDELNSNHIEVQDTERKVEPAPQEQVAIIGNEALVNPVHVVLENQDQEVPDTQLNNLASHLHPSPQPQPQIAEEPITIPIEGQVQPAQINNPSGEENLNEPEVIIQVDPNYTPDGRRIPQTRVEKFLVKCFEDNMVLQKPNITTVAFILVATAFSVLVCIAVSTKEPNLTIIIYGYWIDIIMELILLLLYVKASDMLIIKYSNWAILPWLMKLLMIGSVSADLYRNTNYSIYVCFLVILPCFFNTNANFCYHRITLFGFCLSLILSIAEILVVIKLFSDASFPVRAIFDYLFYFFIVVVFFTGIIFLVSTCGIICHLCKVNREFPLKLKITQWFYGVDTMFEILICFYFGNFIDKFDEYNRFVETKKKQPDFSDLKIQQSLDKSESYRKSVFYLMIATSIYIMVRMFLCFYLTFGIAPIQINRNRNRGATGQGQDHQPKVEKPSGASAVLNLFRINTNYFSSKEKPLAEEGDKKPEGEDSCSICFSNKPNCIILDCKHGGICENCAFDCMKKSIQCPFCRQDITKVCVVEKLNEAQYKVVKEIKP